MHWYLLLFVATALYSVQFVFLKSYQRARGTGLSASLAFNGGAALVQLLLFLCLCGFRFSVTAFSLGIAALFSVATVAMTVVGIRSLAYVQLSQYTFFTMLGGMLLPFAYGLGTGEAVSWQRWIGLALIAAALLIAAGEFRRVRFAGALCCVAVFVCNGSFGILTKWHQSSVNAVPSVDFMLLCSALTAALCIAALPFACAHAKNSALSRRAGERSERLLAPACALGYAAVNGCAQLLVTLCATYVNASVQYPIITGGCVFLSALTGLFFGEKLTVRTVIRIVLVAAGTVLFLF